MMPGSLFICIYLTSRCNYVGTLYIHIRDRRGLYSYRALVYLGYILGDGRRFCYCIKILINLKWVREELKTIIL
ncbi:hypothetical protein GGS20DRAFT_544186 [Poronia punctata]|nr:hypothetical protein GGS20DRAFT_544186 [Poronia punctata]